jgi:GNAT superfamily N-acetyltransferase
MAELPYQAVRGIHLCVRRLWIVCPATLLIAASPDFDSLAVAPTFQGKGYGSKLMSAVLHDAKQRHLNVALCSTSGKFCNRGKTHTNDAPGNPGFYEKFGFREVEKPVMLGEGKVQGVCTELYLCDSFPLPCPF